MSTCTTNKEIPLIKKNFANRLSIFKYISGEKYYLKQFNFWAISVKNWFKKVNISGFFKMADDVYGNVASNQGFV